MTAVAVGGKQTLVGFLPVDMAAEVLLPTPLSLRMLQRPTSGAQVMGQEHNHMYASEDVKVL